MRFDCRACGASFGIPVLRTDQGFGQVRCQLCSSFHVAPSAKQTTLNPTRITRPPALPIARPAMGPEPAADLPPWFATVHRPAQEAPLIDPGPGISPAPPAPSPSSKPATLSLMNLGLTPPRWSLAIPGALRGLFPGAASRRVLLLLGIVFGTLSLALAATGINGAGGIKPARVASGPQDAATAGAEIPESRGQPSRLSLAQVKRFRRTNDKRGKKKKEKQPTIRKHPRGTAKKR